jgi:hypothetical protein
MPVLNLCLGRCLHMASRNEWPPKACLYGHEKQSLTLSTLKLVKCCGGESVAKGLYLNTDFPKHLY